MAGSHHSGRRPNRISSIGKRDLRSLGDRRRVAEADIRSAIYVRPKGPAYDVVKNICNDQEYVVANATGATHTAGQVVPLGSFTGNPGEFTFGKPPAGYGGASAYSIRAVTGGYGYKTTAADPDGNEHVLFLLAAYDPHDDSLVLAGVTHEIVSTPGYVEASVIYRAANAGVPRLSTSPGTFLARVEGGRPVRLAVDLASRRIYLVSETQETAVSPYGEVRRHTLLPSSGGSPVVSFEAEDNSSGGAVERAFSYGDSFYALEGVSPPVAPSGSPPFASGMRVVRRNVSTLAILDYYDIPSVSPFDGAASRGQFPFGCFRHPAGGVRITFGNRDTSLDAWLFVRHLDAGLAFVSDTEIDYNTFNPPAHYVDSHVAAQWLTDGPAFECYDSASDTIAIARISGTELGPTPFVTGLLDAGASVPLIVPTGAARFARLFASASTETASTLFSVVTAAGEAFP